MIHNAGQSITPRKLGLSMPAEWEEHDAVWLAWPHDPVTFPNRVEKVEKVYMEIIRAVHDSETVNLFVKGEGMRERVINLFLENQIDPEKIEFFITDYADVWMRDYGPIFVTDEARSKLAIVHWIFNAWGDKYEGLKKDISIPSLINQKMRLSYFSPQMVLEGGSIDVNGRGTLLTTEQTLLNKNRNPHLSKPQIKDNLKQYLGVDHIIWLKKGIEGDDTDGHIDDIARFVNPTTVLCAYEEDQSDENYLILKENYEILLGAKDQDGASLNIIPLPMPGFVGDGEGRLPASYTNFYIGNKVVLVPVFGHRNDRTAINVIQGVFKDRKVAGIDCTDLVYGFGAIHCITQQQPGVKY